MTPCEQEAWGGAPVGSVLQECPQNPTSFPYSVPRVSRLLADARTVLGGPSAQRTLTGLGKLMPLLRAMSSRGREGP